MKIVILCAIGMAAFLPQYVQALEFGSLRVENHRSEPLKAEVSLQLDSYESKADIAFVLASADHYQSFGIVFNAYVQSIQLKLTKYIGREFKLYLTSSIPFKNISLTVIVKVKRKGKSDYFKVFHLIPKVAVITSLNSMSQYQNQAGYWAKSSRYGPVQAGDSLGEIAMSLRQDKRFSNRLVMLALYEKNRTQFKNEDIHQLKLGAYLQVPDAVEVERLNTAATMQHLNQQLQRARPVKNTLLKNSPVLKKSPPKQKNTGQMNAFLQASKLKVQALGNQFSMIDEGAGKVKKSIVSLEHGLAGLKQDVVTLKQQPLLIQKQPVSYWQWAFYILLILMILWVAGLLLLVMKKSMWKKTPLAFEKTQQVILKPAAKTTEELLEVIAPVPLVPLTTLLEQAESYLDAGDDIKAKPVLEAALAEFPESFKVAALLAKLYHETEQVELRNDLINQMSESSDAEGWECFCDLLDENVWDACFGENRVV